MSEVVLRAVSKRYPDGTQAVRSVDLTIRSGEFVVLLGPSGCGKTTTLRMIAGLESSSSGSIEIAGRDVTHARPAQRDVGFVFQFYALYPHLDVFANIAFPLDCAGMPRAQRDASVLAVARRLGLEDMLRRRPRQLSGGDQQRVALARAMVRRPAVYLMDEPLGTLDARRRAAMCEFLREQQIAQRITTVYVTHDQEEAMRLADRVVVMAQGEVRQSAPPIEVYDRPADRFVAHFVGSPGMNFLEGERAANGAFRTKAGGIELPLPAAASGERLCLGVRPEFVRVGPAARESLFEARVVADENLGVNRALHLDGPAGRIVARVAVDEPARRGDAIGVCFDPRGLRWFCGEKGQALA